MAGESDTAGWGYWGMAYPRGMKAPRSDAEKDCCDVSGGMEMQDGRGGGGRVEDPRLTDCGEEYYSSDIVYTTYFPRTRPANITRVYCPWLSGLCWRKQQQQDVGSQRTPKCGARG